MHLFAALLAELVEEPEHRRAIPARGRPHEPAAVVVDHHGEVALALAVADLVDPDPLETGEQIDLPARFGRDPLADLADGAPRDPHQRSDRGLRGVHRKPRGLVLEGPREPRAMARPRQRAHHDAVRAQLTLGASAST